MPRPRTITAIVGAAILAIVGVYQMQQRHLDHLKVENEHLLARQQQLAAELEAASHAAKAAQEQLGRATKQNSELLRLRNEVSQLREAAKQHAAERAPRVSAVFAENPVTESGLTDQEIRDIKVVLAQQTTKELLLFSVRSKDTIQASVDGGEDFTLCRTPNGWEVAKREHFYPTPYGPLHVDLATDPSERGDGASGSGSAPEARGR